MDQTSPKTVKTLLNENSLSPLKSLGQNFLIDGNIAGKIVDAAVPEGSNALEIGPGLGALTEKLIKRAKAVTAYEIDSGLYRTLKKVFSDAGNLSLIHKDFLKADINSELASQSQEGIFVAASLPYYITTDCILKLLESGLNIKRITVLVQKEVAQKLCAAPGANEYSVLTASVNLFSVPKILFDVPPSCFYPSPNVSSSVLSLEITGEDRNEKKECLRLIRNLFAMRRKTVKSNLRQAYGLSLGEAEAILRDTNVNENARAENLSVMDFKKINHRLNIQAP